jgi:hypothetical protein
MTETNETTPAPDATEKAPAWVDERIQKLSAQRGEALDRITELEKELEGLRPLAESGQAWKTKAEEMEAAHETAAGKWGTERSLLEAGVKDAELRELFAWQYERTPADGRPPFGEWLNGLNAENAPAALRAYLPGEAKSPSTAEAPKSAPQPPPAADTGTKTTPPADRTLSADDIRGSTAENWSQVRERLKAEYSGRRR